MNRLVVLLPLMAIIMMSIFCSCGNSGKPQVDEQAIKDSIAKAFKDSIANAEAEKAKQDSIELYNAIHSKEIIENVIKSFLSEYVNTINDNIRRYLSPDFNKVIDKWERASLGEWNIFGLNSSATVEKYSIIDIGEIKERNAAARVKLSIEDEENYRSVVSTLHLSLINDKWLVDEIDGVKKNMKTYIK